MWTNTKLFCLVLICVFALSSCAKDSEIPEEPVNLKSAILVDNISYSSLESDILDAVNDHRISLGLSVLHPVDDITIQATDHSSYMASLKVVNHDNFDKRYANLVKGIGARAVGENVAYGFISAEAVVKAWIASQGHRENIEGDFTHFGISVEMGKDGRNYFTNIFVRK